MDKAVMISIRPKWTELILDGIKTIEVRKTRPKLNTPFKVYIYHTLPKSGDWNERAGRVVGEFTCDSIEEHFLPYPAYQSEVSSALKTNACLSYTDLHRYIGSGRRFFGWHISDLKIYDEPKELSEFNVSRAFQSWGYVYEDN